MRFNLCLSHLLLSVSTLLAAEPASIRLTLPPVQYAVAGDEMNVYFDNIVLTEHLESAKFTFRAGLGQSQERRWSVTPTEKQAGRHAVKVHVTQSGGETNEAESAFELHVVPANAGADRDVALLMVGDSLTHASVYPNEIARLLSRPGNPRWTMLGTHRPKNAEPGVSHEGYGGWTWARFVDHYEPMPDLPNRKHSSPFVFEQDGRGKLDVTRYLHEKCRDRAPDFITVLLGINDCFAANPEEAADVDRRVDAMFEKAEALLAEFRKAAPKAEIGLCLTTPPNARQSGFDANYQGRYHRWGWKRIQHRIVERQLKHFGRRESEQIFIVPTELNLDPLDGYPVDNGVHPNATGYKQIAASIYAWLKSRLQGD